MSYNKSIKYHKVCLNNKVNISSVSKKKKIHEEIKEYVIDRFINIIYKQNKEILQLKKKLDQITKNSLLILKKSLQWKNILCENQIKLSYVSDLKHTKNFTNNENSNSIIRNNSNLEQEKNNEKSEKDHNNNVKPFINFNPRKLKKYLNLKISLTQSNKINPLNKNNLFFKYNESLNIQNGNLNLKNKTRNFFNKDSTFFSEKQYETFFSDKHNHKIDPIVNYNTKKKIRINSLEKKDKYNNYKDDRIPLKNKFLCENNFENGKPKRINMIDHKKEKINFLNQKNRRKNNNMKRNTAGSLSSLKKLHLSNIIVKNNTSANNNHNIANYWATETNHKYKEKIRSLLSDKKKISSYFQNQKKRNDKKVSNTAHNNMTNNNIFANNKISGNKKLNKIILRMKEIRKNIYSSDLRNLPSKDEKMRKKINYIDMNKTNIIKFFPKSEKFLQSHKSFNEYKCEEKYNMKKDTKYNNEKKKRKSSDTINEIKYIEDKNDNIFQTVYNPTFTSFLDRKKAKHKRSEENNY